MEIILEQNLLSLMAHRESPSWLLLAFYPKILGGRSDLQMVLCHSMNAD